MKDRIVAPQDPDEEAIWQVIVADFVAVRMRDFDAWAKLHVQAPTDRWWASIRSQGVTLNDGWNDIARQMGREIAREPDPQPFLAYGARFENRTLRIMGDMAWATFDIVFPTAGLPGYRGPGIGHSIRVLERHDGIWKVAVVLIMDDQFGRTDTPIWQIDETGRVLSTNPAADSHMKAESELAIRSGRFHLRDRATDRRLYKAIAWANAADWGIMAPHVSTPVVFDPGNDLPARIWWVNASSNRLFVSLNDPSLLPARLHRASIAYGLSPAQHRLASSIVEGLSVIDAARREGIRPSTARTQLQRIFDKVGVRTQPALVRELLSVSGPRPDNG